METRIEPLPEGAPPRIGALGAEIVRVQERRLMPVLYATVVTVIVGASFLLPAAGTALAPVLGPVPTIWVLAGVSILLVALASVVVAVLPPLLLPPEDRAASAVHAWVGAREVRRVLGSAAAATTLPTTPEAADGWLAANPATDRLRSVRIEALVLTGRFDEARAEVARLPAATPIDRYRRLEAEALIDEQAGLPLDEAALREAGRSLPTAAERAEAAAGLAVMLARRALPDGDWRRPLLDARPLVDGTDAAILMRDLAAPIWAILLRRIVMPVALVIVAIATWITIGPRLG